MSRICPLFSGSSGNSTYIGCRNDGILVDIGVSTKKTVAALAELNIDPESIKAVFITHTHSDHISGLKTFVKKYKVQVIASRETLDKLIGKGIITADSARRLDLTAELDNFRVNCFETRHDCDGSRGYVIETAEGNSAAVCTDTGIVTEEIRNSLCGVDAMVFESNHDVTMLNNNMSYPYDLKKRILSENGHLSNGSSASELPGFVKNGTTRIILAHLSRENNTPMLAESTALSVLGDKGVKVKKDCLLYVAAPQSNPMIIF